MKKSSQKILVRNFFHAVLLIGILSVSSAQASEDITGSSRSHKGPNASVSSSDLEPLSLNDKTEPKEKHPTFYSDDKANIDINDNGEPNLNMRF